MYYEKIYTLAIPMADVVHSILNGRIFKIWKDSNDCLHFVDAIYGDALLDTTPITSRVDGDNGYVTILTESCTCYNLRCLSNVLPTGTATGVKPVDDLTDLIHKTREDIDAAIQDHAETKKAIEEFDKVVNETFPMVTTFEVLKEEKDYKSINYGDGYRQITFTFTRDLTEDEFREFCKARNLSLEPKGDWWKDYDMVLGTGNVWTWRHVNVYTD